MGTLTSHAPTGHVYRIRAGHPAPAANTRGNPPMNVFHKLANVALGVLDLKIVRKKDDLLYYLHDYGEGGYESYREMQIFHNKRKIDHVWADDETLKIVAD